MTFLKKTAQLFTQRVFTYIGAFIAAFIIALSSATSVMAHERYIVPSHTLLSGDKAQSVTLMASISNAIFHPDRPLGDSNTGAEVGDLKTLFSLLEHSVIDPQGNITNSTRWQAFARMSVADVALTESGTYRIGLNQPDVHMTTFKKADGTPWRLFGANAKLPEGATNIVRRTTSSRVETFVTFNKTTQQAVNPTGVGVELAGDMHPNDLFANEQVNFQLYFNGKSLTKDVNVKLIKAGTRHRNNRAEQKIAVNDKGEISFTPAQAGFYFLGVETHLNTPDDEKVDVKHFSLYLTLEVFPE